MAALIRCHRPPPRPDSAGVPRRFRPFPLEPPARIHSAGQKLRSLRGVEFITSRKGRLPIFCVRAHPSEKRRIHSRCYSVYSGADNLLMAKSGQTHETNGKLTRLFFVIQDYIIDQKKVGSWNFLKVCILANICLLILPPEALAETCEANSMFSNMPLLFAIALIGATVGGLLARQRRGELERLNGQLRQINAALRRQAVKESYAPSLSYAPVGRIAESEVIVDPMKQQLITKLRTAKNFLRNEDLGKAYVEFKAAFELAQNLGDYVEEKKAARGLGASLQRQGKYKEAIRYYSRILEICKKMGDDSGSTEAYGAIADCYTELGDLERAGKFYDKYIARLD